MRGSSRSKVPTSSAPTTTNTVVAAGELNWATRSWGGMRGGYVRRPGGAAQAWRPYCSPRC